MRSGAGRALGVAAWRCWCRTLVAARMLTGRLWLLRCSRKPAGRTWESLGQGEHAVQAVDVRLRRGEFDAVMLSTWPRRPAVAPLRTRAGDPPLPLPG